MGSSHACVLIVVLMAHSSSFTVGQQCTPLKGSFREKCAVTGYNQTFPIPFEMDQESKEWISKFITYSFDDIANCSVGAIGETILCSAIFAPSCIEGQSKPRLPCRRVCSEYLKRCAATDDEDVDVNWANYLLGLCTLLPNSTASTGECLEPPGFEKYYNSSTTGLLEGGCANLTFPWCQGLNYNHTIAHENVQKNLYKFYYKKNMTGDPVVDAQYDNTTYLHTYDLWMQKFPKCAETIKMMICSGHMPPCFPGEGLAFYTLCSSNCKSILTQCPEIRDSDFYYWLTECEFVAYGNSSHGYCKHTSWPNPHEWLHQKEYFGVRPTSSPPKTSIGAGVIVAAVLVSIIVIGLVIAGVLLWRNRKLPWSYFGLKEDDKRELVT